ncbi:MAG: outer membrane protein assembly factor BamA [Syntrophobacteraceae bacterium]
MRRLLTVLLVLAVISPVWAQSDSPRVAVAPFSINAPQESLRLQQSLQSLLVRQLGQSGMVVMDADVVQRAIKGTGEVASESEARSLGGRVKADYVLFGSLNQVGDYVSIDAKLVDVSGARRTEPLFAEMKGVENLASAVNQIDQQIAVRLLRKAVITDIKIQGNERIEPEAIKANIKSAVGELLRPEQVSEDIKAVNKMGFFEDVQADVTDSPEGGKTLTFVVRENPTVQEVSIKGNKKIEEKDIMAAIATKPYTILQRNTINEDAQKIEKLYHEKAYFNVVVEPSTTFPRDQRNAVVAFNIKEGEKVFIEDIAFVGNKHISSRKLRDVMETKEKGWFHWFSDKGVLQRDKLDLDLDRLAAYYHDKGYMDAKVGSPDVQTTDKGFKIVITVDEGDRYKVESLTITGDALEDEKAAVALRKKLQLKEGEYFSREKLRDDVEAITKAHMNEGYAYAEVNPKIQRNAGNDSATIALDVHRGAKYRIGEIRVSGNTKTRDKVIRRQLALAEGDYFSAEKMERSTTNLKKMDYFEQAEINPVETSQPGVMDLDVKVKEKLTGSISVGGGFSSEDGLFASGEITQRNLFGSGLILSLKAYLGSETTRYSLSFTEPSVMDTFLSAGFDLYNWEKEYTDFTKESVGGKLRFSYPFGAWSRVYFSYMYEVAKVTDVDDDASTIIQDQEGRHTKGSVAVTVTRDSTDHPFLPTKGSINSATMEYASNYLGGDSQFVKLEGETGWYFPLIWKLVGHVRGEVGYLVVTDTEDDIPLYERFFLGGINSLRGFDFADVGPRDPETEDVIGGLKYGLVSLETLFPIYEKMGIRGVVFFDAGNSFAKDEDFDVSDFRTDAGLGVRWNSPMGPLRVEWGYNLNPKYDEDQYKWQFTMGAYF